jgi:hypothetical protein
VKTTIALPDDLYNIVKQWASADGMSINSWMHEAIARNVVHVHWRG